MIPPGLEWLRVSEAGRAWLDALPRRLGECARVWSLTLGPAYRDAHVSYAAPATRADGSEVVFKLQFPHRECEHEALALEVWDGEGAARLLAHDPDRHVLLLERCRPGSSLSECGNDAALEVFVDLLPRLWKPVGAPFATLEQEAERWARNLPRSWERTGRPFERGLLDAALRALEALAPTQPESVLLHQDLHPDNVLRADREPWLAIDPKPLAGERAFSVAPIVRARELGHSRALVLGRLETLCAALDLDPERARGWALIQTLAWGFDADGARPEHVATARWLAEG